MSSLRLMAVAAFAILLASCSTTKDAFYELRAEAAACSPADSCVFAGYSSCICPAAVNASRAAEMNEVAGEVSCLGEGEVECAHGLDEPAECVDARCQPAEPRPRQVRLPSR